MNRLARIPFPITLLLACIAAYGLLAGTLGYYWDGWPLAWIAETYGPDGLAQYFSTNRPVWGWLYRLTMPILGSNPLVWQVFGILTRWLTGLAFWALLKRLWPQRTDVAAWATLLFTLYPGFRQYPIANMYGHFYIVLALALASLWLHLGAAKDAAKRLPLTLAALALGAYCLFATEYFFGLELLRPVLLFLILPVEPIRTRVTNTLRLWWPFTLLILVYAYWRIFVLGFHTYDPTAIASGAPPAQSLLTLLLNAVQGLFTSGLAAWVAPVRDLLAADWASRLTWLAAALVLITGAGCFLAMRSEPGYRRFGWSVAGLGLLALALSILPVLVTGLPIRFDFPNDRLSLPMMAGAALLAVGLVEALLRPPNTRRAAYAVLAGLAVSSQFLVGVAYRQDWRYQASFFQQLLTRAPEVTPGTVFVMHELDGLHLTDNSLVGPLNWLYAPGEANDPISYFAAYFPLRNQPGSFLARLEPGRPITNDFLVARFESSTDQMLVVLFQPPACLRVLHPVYDADYPQLPEDLRAALALSDPDGLIQGEPTVASLFGEELSPTTWCSHFQQADLARQQGDWVTVAALGDAAFELDDSPNHATERLPFIEGYAMTGRWSRAEALTRETLDINPRTAAMLCGVWQRVQAGAAAPDFFTIDAMLELVCE
ncbi:MAG: hypothetical protein EPO32_03720 [Anaerolineae bacterium]|nr:MAG: hypothetical protein EPO32_03720 [Anaerolineae bacterium]